LIENIMNRMLHETMVDSNTTYLNDPLKVKNYCKSILGFNIDEKFHVFFLDQHHRLIHDETLFNGTIQEVAIYPRTIIKKALDIGAVGIVLAHNHPSGNLTPSHHDIQLTIELQNIGLPLGIHVLDHIIVSSKDAISLKELNLI
jgi:DNA repair protein RadC